MENAYSKENCELKHKQIEDDITDIKDRLDKAECDVGNLQTAVATDRADMKHLCDAVEKLTSKIDKIIDQNRGFMVTMLITLLGFFLFVIEQIVAGHIIF